MIDTKMTYYAATTIKSNNRMIYAEQGSVIIVKHKNSDVWICENESGILFPAHSSKLTTEVIKPSIEVKIPIEKKTTESKKPLTQIEKIQIEYLKNLHR